MYNTNYLILFKKHTHNPLELPCSYNQSKPCVFNDPYFKLLRSKTTVFMPKKAIGDLLAIQPSVKNKMLKVVLLCYPKTLAKALPVVEESAAGLYKSVNLPYCIIMIKITKENIMKHQYHYFYKYGFRNNILLAFGNNKKATNCFHLKYNVINTGKKPTNLFFNGILLNSYSRSKTTVIKHQTFNNIFKRYYPGSGLSTVTAVSKMFNRSSNMLFSKTSCHLFKVLQEKAKRDYLLNNPSNPVIFYSYFHKKNESLLYPMNKGLKTIVTNISGIYQAPPDFYNNCENSDTILIIGIKICYLLATNKIETKDDIVVIIEKLLMKSHALDSIYYYPLIQHIMSSLMANFNFSPIILSAITENIVDYSAFQNISIKINNIIEAFVFKKTLYSSLIKNNQNLKVIAQNPDDVTTTHFASIAYKLTKQPHPDYRVEKTIDASIEKTMFYDVKLKTNALIKLPTCKGHLSLTTQYDDIIYMKRFMGDLGNCINATKNELEENVLQKFKIQLSKIIKLPDLNKRLKTFQALQKEIDSNSKIESFVCSRLAEMDTDFCFNEFYGNNPELTLVLVELQQKLKIDQLVPYTGQSANVNAWKEVLILIMTKMPATMQYQLAKNMQRLFELES